MFDLDHIAIWTPQRDEALDAISAAAGLPLLDGYAPGGRQVARGVRFADGFFLDVHAAEGEGGPLLALRGDIAGAERVAAREGWALRVQPRRDDADTEPWAIAAFRRGQGVVSHMFVIDYAPEPQAWTSPTYNGGLYRYRRADAGARLRTVVVGAQDAGRATSAVEAFGVAAGRLAVAPSRTDGYMTLVVEGGVTVLDLRIGPRLTIRISPVGQEG